VESIGSDAFSGCSALREVICPKLISLGTGAFYANTVLSYVEMPVLTTLPNCNSLNALFNHCNALQTVKLPSVTILGSSSFYNSKVKELYLGTVPPYNNGAETGNSVTTIYVPQGSGVNYYSGVNNWTDAAVLAKVKEVAPDGLPIPQLTTLTISGGGNTLTSLLTPTFNPRMSQESYYITLPASASSVTFLGTKDVTTIMEYSVDGSTGTGIYNIDPGDTLFVNITLTGSNGKQRVYTFAVYRQP
jgi:hypothetical protein